MTSFELNRASWSNRRSGRAGNKRWRPVFEQLEDRAVPAIFVVNTNVDTVDASPGDGSALDGAGNTSLRAAIMEANALAGTDTIELPAGTYDLAIAGTGEDAAARGDLDITGNLTIVGADRATTIIDANRIDRVFAVARNATVEFRSLTITGGQAINDSTLGGQDRGGGMLIDFFSNVAIVDTLFVDNIAPRTAPGLVFGLGGAITNKGFLTIQDSRFENNFASNAGGAIYIGGIPSTTTIRNTTFANNTANGGGAIFNHERMTIENSAFVGNGSGALNRGNGGAINNNGGGDLKLINSTVSGNLSNFGGGIINFDRMQIRNSTITNNRAGWGGGIDASRGVTLENTIVANNNAATRGPDVRGAVVSLGHNLVGNTTDSLGFGAAGDLLNVDPKLEPLADNGGLTLTHALMPDSPARDAANTASAPAADQRGVARPQGAAADIGAFELAANRPPLAGDDSYATDEDVPLIVGPADGVLANDSDPDDDTLTAMLVAGPSHGALTLNSDGSFTYTPDADFNGSDSFTYKANDGSVDSNEAVVNITVRAVNDAPVARGDAYGTSQGVLLNVPAPGVLGNDNDAEGDALTAALVSGPGNGTLSLNADGSFSYVPNPGFSGADSFTYKANDGAADSNVATVELTVASAPSNAGKITGHGNLDGGLRSFNINVQARDHRGVLSFFGDLSFEDLEHGISLHSTSITSFRVEADGIRGVISGAATVNGRSGYFFTALLEDHGEPGTGADKFRILISGPAGFQYDSLDFASAAGLLEGGNLQVHRRR